MDPSFTSLQTIPKQEPLISSLHSSTSKKSPDRFEGSQSQSFLDRCNREALGLNSQLQAIEYNHALPTDTASAPGTLARSVGKELRCVNINSDDVDFEDVNLDDDCGSSEISEEGIAWNAIDNITALGLSFDPDVDTIDTSSPTRFEIESPESVREHAPDQPFNKWVKTIHRRARRQRKNDDKPVLSITNNSQVPQFDGPIESRHKKSSSGSSIGFVTAVKSASISLASFSIRDRSKRTKVSSRHFKTDGNSRVSNSGLRYSEDGLCASKNDSLDIAVVDRSIQRRRVLEEFINTEENYVADIRFLMQVYVTLLASIPTISISLRSSINRNLTEIVELHEEILGDLHRIVPHSEYTQSGYKGGIRKTHQRWKSLDSAPTTTKGFAWIYKVPGMTAEPQVAAEVAKIFGRKMNRFFAYEEYGAKYELMVKDVASTYRTLPQWEAYQKGLEALAASLSSVDSQHERSKKSLTVGDLLIKPIQRVCRYPLLFAELLKQTPVCDSPDSHLEIEKALSRLREMTTKINRATDDPKMRASIEKTWILQDRLIFTNQSTVISRAAVRSLGHVELCGVLHISWQTRKGVDGQYMICLLFRDYLVLAIPSQDEQQYMIQANIALADARIEEVDNGRGLQCHTAPYSWKLVFECDHKLHEVIMNACSPKEELEWRRHVQSRVCKELAEIYDNTTFTVINLSVKSLGTVFGKPGTVARRLSIHRATTIGPKSALCQLVIKNTSANRQSHNSPCAIAINRSQSLLTTNRIPVLAPTRDKRVRLENILHDVWSRDVLPFPGMTSRVRSNDYVRASATSVMRKLSVASIASSFTKRSTSVASVPETGERAVELDPTKGSCLETSTTVEETASSSGSDISLRKRHLSVIPDEDNSPRMSEELVVEKKNHDRSASGQASWLPSMVPRKRTSWQVDEHRIITPPLRASSTNSIRTQSSYLHTGHPSSMEPLVTGVENVSCPALGTQDVGNDKSLKHGKRRRIQVLNKGFSTEGLKSLFR